MAKKNNSVKIKSYDSSNGQTKIVKGPGDERAFISKSGKITIMDGKKKTS